MHDRKKLAVRIKYLSPLIVIGVTLGCARSPAPEPEFRMPRAIVDLSPTITMDMPIRTLGPALGEEIADQFGISPTTSFEVHVETDPYYLSMSTYTIFDLQSRGPALRKRSGNGVVDNPINAGPEGIVGKAFLPQSRRQRGDITCGMILDALQHIDHVDVGVDPLQPACGDQALEDADTLGADLGPAEHPILAAESDGSDLPLEVIRVDRHVGVFEKYLQRVLLASEGVLGWLW